MANIKDDFFPSRFLSAADLKGKEVDVTIDHVGSEELENDGLKKMKPVIFFKNKNVKPMIANKTNSMMIAAACGDTDYTNWSGKQIRLYAELVSFKGAVVEAVRVKRVPKPLAEDLNDEIPL